MRKIIYSSKYGVGWVNSCSSREIAKFAISYPAIVEAIERGERLDNNTSEIHPEIYLYHPAVQQFIKEAREKFHHPEDPEWMRYTPYLGILNNLAVKEVPDECLVKIKDYDGKETVQEYYPDMELF